MQARAPLAALLAALACLAACKPAPRATGELRQDPGLGRFELLAEAAATISSRDEIPLRFSHDVEVAQWTASAVRVYSDQRELEVRVVQGEGRRVALLRAVRAWPEGRELEIKTSPLIFDTRGRILDQTLTRSVRVRDAAPPRLQRGSAERAVARLEYDEELARMRLPETELRVAGRRVAHRTFIEGSTLLLVFDRSQPGGASIDVVVDGLEDRDGVAASRHSWAGAIEADGAGPALLTQIPARGAKLAKAGAVALRFDATLDREALTILGSQELRVGFASGDRHVTIEARSGAWSGETLSLRLSGIRGVDGKPGPEVSLRFETVASTPPRILSSHPERAAASLTRGAPIELRSTRPIADASLAKRPSAFHTDHELHLEVVTDGASIAWPYEVARSAVGGDAILTITPRPALAVGTRCVLRGAARSDDGRALPAEDLAPSQFRIVDADAVRIRAPRSQLSVLERVSLRFDRVVLEVLPGAIEVLALGSREIPIAARARIDGSGHEVEIDADLEEGRDYAVCVRSGIAGPRFEDGQRLSPAATRRFEFAVTQRTQPGAKVELRVAGVRTDPREGEVALVPRESCRFQVDELRSSLIASSVRFSLRGHEQRDAAALRSSTDWIGPDGRITLDLSGQLEAGVYALEVEGIDGHAARWTSGVRFEIVERQQARRPFAQIQVVHVDFTARDPRQRGTAWGHDLELLGLIPGETSALHTDALEAVTREVMRSAHEILGRDALGDPGPAAARIRLTREEHAGESSSLVVGGLDPFGPAGRTLGDTSTGYVGRASFDHANRDRRDGRARGFGVFPRELILSEVLFAHARNTPFFRDFAAMCPRFGGTPFGTLAIDARILRGIDLDRAPPNVRARALAWAHAKNGFARAIARLIAHEVGHLVGLVPTGALPRGLRGARDLHAPGRDGNSVMNAHSTWMQLSGRSLFSEVARSYLRGELLVR